MAPKGQTKQLKEGDRNTKYFHKCATQKGQANSIKSITSENGSLASSQEEIAKTFQSFYQSLFSTSDPESIPIIPNSLQPLVTKEMNCSLTRAYTKEEVERAILKMNP